MFKLDMNAIRKAANDSLLPANPANTAANDEPEVRNIDLAEIAALAGSSITFSDSPELLTARLIAAAMRVCDAYGDGPPAREQMRQDCLETPIHLRQDLLDYFLGKPRLH